MLRCAQKAAGFIATAFIYLLRCVGWATLTCSRWFSLANAFSCLRIEFAHPRGSEPARACRSSHKRISAIIRVIRVVRVRAAACAVPIAAWVRIPNSQMVAFVSSGRSGPAASTAATDICPPERNQASGRQSRPGRALCRSEMRGRTRIVCAHTSLCDAHKRQIRAQARNRWRTSYSHRLPRCCELSAGQTLACSH